MSDTPDARSKMTWSMWAYLGLAALWAYALIKPVFMWDWKYYHDTPLLNFAGVMMHDFGLAPYRDMFETTMPGTFLFHYIITGMGLEAQTPFVVLGVLAMGVLAGLGAWTLSHISRPAALLFPPFYLMFILQFGPAALFQREILGLLAITPALVLATKPGGAYLLRQGLIGLCFGIACTIKPQFALGAPAAVLCLAALSQDARGFIKTAMAGILASVAGFALPLLAAFWWLWTYGALEEFLFILTEYTQYYIQQTQSHAFTTPERRAQYLWDLWIKFAGFWTLLPGTLMLAVLVLGYRTQIARSRAIVLTTLVASVAIYGLVPVLSGQFWDYHYFPFMYLSILAASALFGFALEPVLTQGGRLACFGVVAVTLGLNIAPVPNLEWRQGDAKERLALALDMETALRKWVPENGHVQPIDWTAGALHAMMRARIPIATRFFYDFHFAHHASTPINARLRSRFLDELATAAPEVMLIAHTRMKVFGLDVSYEFPELDAFMENGYRVVEENAQFSVLLRRDL